MKKEAEKPTKFWETNDRIPLDYCLNREYSSTEESIPIIRSEITLGRAYDCTIPLISKRVSRIHCEISTRGRQIYVRDNNSSNGTFINATKIKGETQLKVGDLLGLGVRPIPPPKNDDKIFIFSLKKIQPSDIIDLTADVLEDASMEEQVDINTFCKFEEIEKDHNYTIPPDVSILSDEKMGNDFIMNVDMDFKNEQTDGGESEEGTYDGGCEINVGKVNVEELMMLFSDSFENCNKDEKIVKKVKKKKLTKKQLRLERIAHLKNFAVRRLLQNEMNKLEKEDGINKGKNCGKLEGSEKSSKKSSNLINKFESDSKSINKIEEPSKIIKKSQNFSKLVKSDSKIIKKSKNLSKSIDCDSNLIKKSQDLSKLIKSDSKLNKNGENSSKIIESDSKLNKKFEEPSKLKTNLESYPKLVKKIKNSSKLIKKVETLSKLNKNTENPSKLIESESKLNKDTEDPSKLNDCDSKLIKKVETLSKLNESDSNLFNNIESHSINHEKDKSHSINHKKIKKSSTISKIKNFPKSKKAEDPKNSKIPRKYCKKPKILSLFDQISLKKVHGLNFKEVRIILKKIDKIPVDFIGPCEEINFISSREENSFIENSSKTPKKITDDSNLDNKIKNNLLESLKIPNESLSLNKIETAGSSTNGRMRSMSFESEEPEIIANESLDNFKTHSNAKFIRHDTHEAKNNFRRINLIKKRKNQWKKGLIKRKKFVKRNIYNRREKSKENEENCLKRKIESSSGSCKKIKLNNEENSSELTDKELIDNEQTSSNILECNSQENSDTSDFSSHETDDEITLSEIKANLLSNPQKNEARVKRKYVLKNRKPKPEPFKPKVFPPLELDEKEIASVKLLKLLLTHDTQSVSKSYYDITKKPLTSEDVQDKIFNDNVKYYRGDLNKKDSNEVKKESPKNIEKDSIAYSLLTKNQADDEKYSIDYKNKKPAKAKPIIISVDKLENNKFDLSELFDKVKYTHNADESTLIEFEIDDENSQVAINEDGLIEITTHNEIEIVNEGETEIIEEIAAYEKYMADIESLENIAKKMDQETFELLKLAIGNTSSESVDDNIKEIDETFNIDNLEGQTLDDSLQSVENMTIESLNEEHLIAVEIVNDKIELDSNLSNIEELEASFNNEEEIILNGSVELIINEEEMIHKESEEVNKYKSEVIHKDVEELNKNEEEMTHKVSEEVNKNKHEVIYKVIEELNMKDDEMIQTESKEVKQDIIQIESKELNENMQGIIQKGSEELNTNIKEIIQIESEELNKSKQDVVQTESKESKNEKELIQIESEELNKNKQEIIQLNSRELNSNEKELIQTESEELNENEKGLIQIESKEINKSKQDIIQNKSKELNKNEEELIQIESEELNKDKHEVIQTESNELKGLIQIESKELNQNMQEIIQNNSKELNSIEEVLIQTECKELNKNKQVIIQTEREELNSNEEELIQTESKEINKSKQEIIQNNSKDPNKNEEVLIQTESKEINKNKQNLIQSESKELYINEKELIQIEYNRLNKIEEIMIPIQPKKLIEMEIIQTESEKIITNNLEITKEQPSCKNTLDSTIEPTKIKKKRGPYKLKKNKVIENVIKKKRGPYKKKNLNGEEIKKTKEHVCQAKKYKCKHKKIEEQMRKKSNKLIKKHNDKVIKKIKKSKKITTDYKLKELKVVVSKIPEESLLEILCKIPEKIQEPSELDNSHLINNQINTSDLIEGQNSLINFQSQEIIQKPAFESPQFEIEKPQDIENASQIQLVKNNPDQEYSIEYELPNYMPSSKYDDGPYYIESEDEDDLNYSHLDNEKIRNLPVFYDDESEPPKSILKIKSEKHCKKISFCNSVYVRTFIPDAWWEEQNYDEFE